MTFGEDHDDDCECDEHEGFKKAMLALRLASAQICEGNLPDELPGRLATLIAAVIGVTCSALKAREQALESFQDQDEVDEITASMLNDVTRAAVSVAMRFAEADKDPLPRFSVN